MDREGKAGEASAKSGTVTGYFNMSVSLFLTSKILLGFLVAQQ